MFVNQILPNQSDPFIPIIHEISADLETPVSAYLKLADAGASFLLESVSGGEQLARYSFLGVNLQHAYVLKDGKLAHHTPEGVSYLPIESNETPLDVLRKVLRQYQDGMKSLQGLPRFFGGLVGYLGYEIVRYFECPQRCAGKHFLGCRCADCFRPCFWQGVVDCQQVLWRK